MTTSPGTSRASGWYETPFFFDAGSEVLFGILTESCVRRSQVAVVHLRGGNQGPSSGRNGTSTRLCRRLALGGFDAVRFDYRGVGESTGLVEVFRMDRPFTEDLDGAVEWLRGRGTNRFALIGVCFGARTAIVHAAGMSGVEAVVLLAATLRDREKDETGTKNLTPDRTPLPELARRALRAPVIMKAFQRTGRHAYSRLVRRELRARDAFRRQRPENGEFYWVSRTFLTGLEETLSRGVPVLFVRGKADPGFDDFDRALTGPLGDVIGAAGGLVQVEVFEGRVGGYSDPVLEEPVVDLVTAWLSEKVG